TSNPACRTPEVVALAQAAYDDRVMPGGGLDPVRITALADALERAGATPELVAHLRADDPHVWGCWAVDAVLGREGSWPVSEPGKKEPVKPVVAPSTEFAPLQMLGDDPGSFSLLLTEFDRWAGTFEEAGQDGGGYGWHGVADALIRLKAPKLKKKVQF